MLGAVWSSLPLDQYGTGANHLFQARRNETRHVLKKDCLKGYGLRQVSIELTAYGVARTQPKRYSWTQDNERQVLKES